MLLRILINFSSRFFPITFTPFGFGCFPSSKFSSGLNATPSNKNGKKEWEYVNKDKNGDIGYINWSRIVEDKTLIEKFRLLVRNKEC